MPSGKGTRPKKGTRAKKVSKADQAQQKLADALRAGQYQANAPVPELPTAERFDIGRTPAREAILQLVAVGLLVKKDNHRAHVPSLARDCVLDLVDAFFEIEAACLRLAVLHMTAAKRIEIRQMTKALQAQAALPDLVAVAVALRKFVRANCGNRELAAIAEFVEMKFGPYRNLEVDADKRDLRFARILAKALSRPEGQAPVRSLRTRMLGIRKAIAENWRS